jgi:hypothetical protein
MEEQSENNAKSNHGRIGGIIKGRVVFVAFLKAEA